MDYQLIDKRFNDYTFIDYKFKYCIYRVFNATLLLKKRSLTSHNIIISLPDVDSLFDTFPSDRQPRAAVAAVLQFQ